MRLSTMLPFLALTAFLSFTSCSTEEFPENDANSINLLDAPAPKDIEMDILRLINDYRTEQGLNTLNDHNVIKSVAYTHTDYMIEVDNVSHDNFYQRKISLEQNANATRVSENVAYGFSSAQSVVNAWINSPAHRETLEGDFTDFDISAEQDEDGDWYYTNIFIKR